MKLLTDPRFRKHLPEGVRSSVLPSPRTLFCLLRCAPLQCVGSQISLLHALSYRPAMGTKLSVSIEGATKPEIAPRVDRPPTFDPLSGFDKPRKVWLQRCYSLSGRRLRRAVPRGQEDGCVGVLSSLLKRVLCFSLRLWEGVEVRVATCH